MTSLELNDLSAKAEQSGKNEISAFYHSKVIEGKVFAQKAEAERGRDTPEKRLNSPATTDTLLSTYEKEKRQDYGPGRQITAVLYLQNFMAFLKQNTLKVMDFAGEQIHAFENYLFSLHDSQSIPYSAKWIWQNIVTVKAFLTWHVRQGDFPENPLETFTQDKAMPRYERQYEERRLSWQKERLGKQSDAKLLTLFEEHIQAHYPGKINKHRVILAVAHFARFAKEKGKALREFQESDLQAFLERHSHHEVHPCLRISLHTFMANGLDIRIFSRWLYEYGYHSEHFLWNWSLESLRRFWKTQEEKPVAPQGRYYNAQELLRAYRLYLKKIYFNFSHHFHLTTSLKFYITFLSGRNKTVYSADEETMEAFKKYLLEYEYAPGRYFKASFQAFRLNHIKRFYDWFTCQGYGKNHPLKEYRATAYEDSIEEACKKRKAYSYKPEDIQEPFREAYQGFLDYERRRGYCGNTYRTRDRGTRVFFGYLHQVGVTDLKEVNEQHLNEYQNYLIHFEHTKGVPISLSTRVSILVAVKMFFHYLARFAYLPRDPSHCIDLPRNPKGLPTSGMTDLEFRKLIERVQEIRKENWLRDSAMLEALYSTGLRSNELRTLKVPDVDLHAGLVRVNTPKGGIAFQRVVPIGKTACHWINRYIKEERSRIKDLKSDVLFLSKFGLPLSTGLLLNIVKIYHMKTGNRKNIVTHSMRVSCATEMLRNKANIKYVQEQLGHRSIESTGRYLRLMPSDLKEVHSKCHPREKKPQVAFLYRKNKKATETKPLKN